MKVVFATGIYPPDIGGPATYVERLAGEMTKAGEEVVVITYGENEKLKMKNEKWTVVRVSKWGGPLLRWRRYAKALKKHGHDADIVYAFSSVSCGIPLFLARLKKPKKILRLGGDFLWERYTDRGGRLDLRAWYASSPKLRPVMQKILSGFDHIVFSTQFQEELYKEHYPQLPQHSVIENAVPEALVHTHSVHDPLQLLFMGRFVAFKNLPVLLQAIARMRDARLTIVGRGPCALQLTKLVKQFDLEGRVIFVAPVHGEEKEKVFAGHDVLVIPSLTEISPNVALEARAHGLPVLLTKETGLSAALTNGMVLRDLSSVDHVVTALQDIHARYPQYAQVAATPSDKHRGWKDVCNDHLLLFHSLFS
jgi:glycosyltransferase involved in cell wall biosynthesis